MKEMVRTPQEVGVSYQDVYFRAENEVPLHGWWLPAVGESKGTVLFLHGNAENISTHLASVHWLPAEGYSVFLFDYRGYGLSEGKADLGGLHRDAEAALGYVLMRQESQRLPVIVFGQSLGGAIAIHMTAESPYRSRISALVVESAFASYRDIFREKLSLLWLTWPLQYPLSWSVSDRYRPLDSIDKISPIPLVLVYADQDPIVPRHHGERLFEQAREPKQMWRYPSGNHIAAFTRAEMRQRLVDYLNALPKSSTRWASPVEEQIPLASQSQSLAQSNHELP